MRAIGARKGAAHHPDQCRYPSRVVFEAGVRSAARPAATGDEVPAEITAAQRISDQTWHLDSEMTGRGAVGVLGWLVTMLEMVKMFHF